MRRTEVGASVAQLISAGGWPSLGDSLAQRTCRLRFRHVAIHYGRLAVGINMIDLRRRRRRRLSVAPSVRPSCLDHIDTASPTPL